jgi:hypothetical protein
MTKQTVAFRSFVNAPKDEEDLMYINSLALVSHPRSSCAHDISITDCCKVKNMKLKVSSNNTISVPSFVKMQQSIR